MSQLVKVYNISQDKNVNYCKVCRLKDNTIPSTPNEGCFGNPFILKDVNNFHQRLTSINGYRHYFYKKIDDEPEFKKAVIGLKNKNLGCFCRPELCHSDVIINYLYHQDLNPDEDGDTHINVYSKGQTEIGLFLTNFADWDFKCEDGKFACVEGYWYWLFTKDERLHKTNGFESKALGKELKSTEYYDESVAGVDFQEKIQKAIKTKLDFIIKRGIFEYKAPFVHYYNYSGKVVIPYEHIWIVEYINYYFEVNYKK